MKLEMGPDRQAERWAVYRRPDSAFTAEIYSGTRHIAAVAMTEKAARAFADSQNRALAMQERIARRAARRRRRVPTVRRVAGAMEARDG